jgi:hypothetical protein
MVVNFLRVVKLKVVKTIIKKGKRNKTNLWLKFLDS